ncbi:MAG: hypothetical protein GY749_13550 [Desulfobacteraceae bacterium]|nr:hypothetical protein [Desulfobacteraceae bacterium]
MFQKLSQCATLVYLRPFEDESTCWKSVLLKMVQELKFPDRVELEYCSSDEPTQLEAFAHGILAHLLANAVENGTIPHKNNKTLAQNIRKSTVVKFRNNTNWVQENYNNLVILCSQQIETKGIQLNASALSWLRVLFTYAYFPSEIELRETCLDWLQGGSIDQDDAERIGIRNNDSRML